MKKFIQDHPFILMEAAIIERLRRSDDLILHQHLLNAPLIYDQAGRQALGRIYQEYIKIALSANLPLLICTPTWRANRARVRESGITHSINSDAARFMNELCQVESCQREMIKIGGMIGCKNDCYRPEEGLPAKEAEEFHRWQIDQLARSNLDFLMAATLPAVEEALGIAHAMAVAEKDYIISFVISRNGNLLDGTDLLTAIERIDSATRRKPLGYMVNCAYPAFLNPGEQPPALFKRLIGYQANASSLDHDRLDHSEELHAESIPEWGDSMIELHRRYGIRILGGCCGTSGEHLNYIAASYLNLLTR
jgi:S-methylmethionine-dependent homocysteine/selenocysteine methylase